MSRTTGMGVLARFVATTQLNERRFVDSRIENANSCIENAYVHLQIQDVLTLFNSWKEHRTLLLIHVSAEAVDRDLQTTVKALEGTTIRLGASSEDIQIDLAGGEFRGDTKGEPKSNLGAFLVCELRNDHRWAFYARREGY